MSAIVGIGAGAGEPAPEGAGAGVVAVAAVAAVLEADADDVLGADEGATSSTGDAVVAAVVALGTAAEPGAAGPLDGVEVGGAAGVVG
jgi:hypothetical protein